MSNQKIDSTQVDFQVGANLTVKEADGAPTVSNVDTIVVSNGTLTDDGGGQVTLTTGGGGGGTPAGSDKNVQYNNSGSFGGVSNNATATPMYLKQASGGTPAFAQPAHSDLSGVSADQHHAQSHNHSASGDGTSLSPATLIAPNATSPAQTTDGSIVWDSDDDVLTIGDGASRKTFPYKGSTTPAALGTASAGSGNEASLANHVHAKATESELNLSDVTTLNASTSLHGFLKKLDNTATNFMDGTGNWDSVKDSDLSTSDITTNDVTTSKHGFTPKAPNDATKFLRGDASWAVPTGGTILNVNVTEVGNVGSGEDNLITYDVPANTLDTNGQYLHFVMAGIFAGNVNNKTIKVYFGSTVLLDTGALAVASAADWMIDGYIIREGASVQKCSVRFSSSFGTLMATANYVGGTEDLTTQLTLKATGTATSNDDIVQESLIVEKGGGTGGGGSGGYPENATIWCDEFVTEVAGTWVNGRDTNLRYQTYTQNTSSNDADAVEFTFFLKAGTYTLYALGIASGSYGKTDITIDGGSVVATFDWYAGVTSYNVVKSQASVTVATDGQHTLRLTLNGKNVSSTDYDVALTKIWFH